MATRTKTIRMKATRTMTIHMMATRMIVTRKKRFANHFEYK